MRPKYTKCRFLCCCGSTVLGTRILIVSFAKLVSIYSLVVITPLVATHSSCFSCVLMRNLSEKFRFSQYTTHSNTQNYTWWQKFMLTQNYILSKPFVNFSLIPLQPYTITTLRVCYTNLNLWNLFLTPQNCSLLKWTT